MNGLNQQVKKCLLSPNYRIYEHGTFFKIYISKRRKYFVNRLSDAEFRLSLERLKPRSDIVLDQHDRDIRRLRNDIELAQIRSRSSSPVPR